MSHVFSVGMMLAHHGYPEDVIIAGILHDIVEDTEITLEALRREFGGPVARLVECVSEPDKSLPWQERKARYLEQLRSAGEEAQAISCCGVTHNMKSILGSLGQGEDIWQRFKRGKEEQLEQFGKLLTIYRALENQEMVREYEAALEHLRTL